MKKVVFGLLLLATSLCVSHAQNIKWGKLNEANYGKYTPLINQWSEDGLYVLAHNYNGTYYVESYDSKNYARKLNKEIVLPVINKYQTELEQVSFIKGKCIVFCSYYDRKNKLSVIYAYSIDTNNGEISKKRIKLLEVPVEGKRRKGDFDVTISRDLSKVLVNHSAFYKKEEVQRYSYVLFNSDLEILMEKNVEQDRNEENYKLSSYIIDNEGSVYHMKHYGDGGTFIVSYDVNTGYEKWEERLSVNDINPNHSITNTRVSFNKKDNLVLTSYIKSEKSLEGIFYMEMDRLSKEIIKSKVTIFDEEQNEEINKSFETGWSKVPLNYNIVEHLYQPNGNLVLVGESFSQYVVYSNYSTTVTSNYNDILVMSISPDGDVLMTKRVPKYQKNASVAWIFRSMRSIYKELEYFSTITCVGSDSKLYMLYNDHVGNISKLKNAEDIKKMRNYRASQPIIGSVDLATGEFTKQVINSAKKDKFLIKPSIYLNDQKDEQIVVFTQKGSNYMFGNLVLPKPKNKDLSKK